VRLDKLFLDTHEEMVARNLRVMQVPLLLSRAYYFRSALIRSDKELPRINHNM